MKHKISALAGRRLLSVFLAVILCLALLPATALAADTNKAIQVGTPGIKDPTKLGNTHYRPNSYIYFGVNGSDDEPIKWRVLDADKANDRSTNGVFLLSEYLLSKPFQFNTNKEDGDSWQESKAQEWCSSFASNASNFSPAEQAAMLGVAKTEDAGSRKVGDNETLRWTKSSLTAQDKMFFLSVSEVCDYVAYYASESWASATDTKDWEGSWWLRTPDDPIYSASLAGTLVYLVAARGWMASMTVNDNSAARPAFNLNLNSVLFTSAAEYGKANLAGDGILIEVPVYRGNEWKLTLLDESRSEFTASTTARTGNTLTVKYENATTGANEYISAIVKAADGSVSYYGRIAQLDGMTNGESGTVSITLPACFDKDADTLCVFNEQYNGAQMTDYASNLCTVEHIGDNGDEGDYTVSFHANGGSGEMADVTGVSGSYTLPVCGFTAPKDKQFKGWATSETGGVISGTTITVTGDTTLYAVWEENSGEGYGVTVNGTSVTDANAANVLTDESNSGKVSYDTETNTITIHGCLYTASGYKTATVISGNGTTDIVIIGDGTDNAAFGLTVTNAKDVKVTQANGGQLAILGGVDIACCGNVEITHNANCFGVNLNSDTFKVRGAKDVTVSSTGVLPVIRGTGDGVEISCSGNVEITCSNGNAVEVPLFKVTAAKDVTVSAKTIAVKGAADVTCSGTVLFRAKGTSSAVTGNITYQQSSGADYMVYAGTGEENLSRLDSPDFSAPFEYPAVKIIPNLIGNYTITVSSSGALSVAVAGLDAGEEAAIVAAQYNGARMVDVQTASVTGTDSVVERDFSFTASKGNSYKVFLLSGTGAPLCAAKSTT